MAERKQERYLALDGLRGVCALSIVLYHAKDLFIEGRLMPRAYLAVDIFFIMSGFVLALAYEERLAKGLSARDFVNMRIRRLAPVYWFGCMLGAASLAVFWHYGLLAGQDALLLAALAFLLAPTSSTFSEAFNVNGPAWSLLSELVVNLLYAAVAKALSGRALVAIILVGYAACGFCAALSPDGFNFGWRYESILLGPVRAIPSFAAGVLIFRLSRSGDLRRLPDIDPVYPIAAWLLVEMVPTALPALADLLVVAVLGTLAVALLARSSRQPRAFAWLGAISYALYACHYPILLAAEKTPLFGFDAGPDPLKAGMLVLVVTGMAWGVHVALERRMAFSAARGKALARR